MVSRAPPGFSPERLADFLAARVSHGRCVIAYSGGMDSTVLLHALAACRQRLPPLHAVHVDHGLSLHAKDFARHCREQCQAWRISLQVIETDARPPPGKSPEAWARQRRYKALAAVLESGEFLLSAHHADDQIETLLLRLLRGSGPRGLAAMRADRPLGKGRLLRPMLQYQRREIKEYAGQHQLQWVEDKSNAELHADRNYLRHRVLPLLSARWPGATTNLRRACALQAWAATLLDGQARRDLDKARNRNKIPGIPPGLDLHYLRTLAEERSVNLLHYWLREQGQTPPTARNTRRILEELFPDTPGSPRLALPGDKEARQLRRYRSRLYLLPVTEPATILPQAWRLPAPLRLPNGTLTAFRCEGKGLAARKIPRDTLEVRIRQGGERIRPAGKKHHRSLKKLWQEWKIPPWQRKVWPLLYSQGRLAAVPGKVTAHEFTAVPGETAWEIRWQPT